eukprot:59390_1
MGNSSHSEEMINIPVHILVKTFTINGFRYSTYKQDVPLYYDKHMIGHIMSASEFKDFTNSLRDKFRITKIKCDKTKSFCEVSNETALKRLNEYDKKQIITKGLHFSAALFIDIPVVIQMKSFTIDRSVVDKCKFCITMKYNEDTVLHSWAEVNKLFTEKMCPALYDWKPLKAFSGITIQSVETNLKLNEYDKQDIVEKGIHLKANLIKFEHKIESQITCKNLLQSENQKDPLNCPFYEGTLKNYVFDEEHFIHLCSYTHHISEYKEKPECQYGVECYAYKRLKDGKYQLNDRCHAKLYRHPPRSKHIELQSNIFAFQYKSANVSHSETKDNEIEIPVKSKVINKDKKDDKQIEKKETDDDVLKPYQFTIDQIYEFMDQKWDEQNYIVQKFPIEIAHITDSQKPNFVLKALIAEVVRNGYESDLCLDKDVDVQNHNHTLMRIVREKMNHWRHRRMGSPLHECFILSLLLYTGCKCNGDLCTTQRDGDYEKWQVFDWCLHEAIRRLNKYEIGNFMVYSGVAGVKLKQKRISGYFVTYASSSWKREVAAMFAGGEGMIFEIDAEFRKKCICCDVSWISDYDEYEVLFSRMPNFNNRMHDNVTVIDDNSKVFKGMKSVNKDAFECCVIDDPPNAVQTVSLKWKGQSNHFLLCDK